MSKGSVYLDTPGIGRVITIWDEVFCKLRMSFGGLVSMKGIFSESSHCIDKNIDVVVEVLDIHISVSFEFYIDEELIEFW